MNYLFNQVHYQKKYRSSEQLIKNQIKSFNLEVIVFICTACNTDHNDGENAQKNSDKQRNLAASDAIMKAFQTGNIKRY
jgi:hypothetical protein